MSNFPRAFDSQKPPQTLRCRRFILGGRKAQDAVHLRYVFKAVRAENGAIRKARTGLARPLVAKQARYAYVQQLI